VTGSAYTSRRGDDPRLPFNKVIAAVRAKGLPLQRYRPGSRDRDEGVTQAVIVPCPACRGHDVLFLEFRDGHVDLRSLDRLDVALGEGE
jgi:hypothetical protein